MYLKELEIFGFKSFPQKTSLTFGPGITAVVGPNGCGKSNVFDSIKWALGEQSPKSLRGAKMEDIIFNGTENLAPLNYAEVTLNFCNEDRYLPIDYKEVAISRRLYRTGESQYFINKNVVRLKDVQDLFMGTGIGESTYSFIEQGKIEIFLSYKPEDKRLIFDEASGIVKYKDRKKETLKKLGEAEENLLRLEDIISEVKRQTRYLERQVEKAKKYKEINEQLIEVEKKIATLQFADLEGKAKSLNQELEVLEDKSRKKNEQLSEVNNRLEELSNEAKNLRISLEDAATAIVSLNSQIDNSSNHININEQRINELKIRNESLKQNKVSLNQRLLTQQERTSKENQQLKILEENFLLLDEAVKKLEKEGADLKVNIEKNKAIISQEKAKILDYESKKVQYHNEFVQKQTHITALNNRKKRLLLDKARLETLLTENKEKLKEVEGESHEAEKKLEVLQGKKSGLIQKNKELTVFIENTRSKIVEKEKDLVELKASYDFLKDFRLKYETFSVKKKITVIFEEEPVNINKLVASLQNVTFIKEKGAYKAQIEAKIISFEEKQLEEKIFQLKSEIDNLKVKMQQVEQEQVKINEELSSENSRIEEANKELNKNLQAKDIHQREAERLEEEFDLLKEEEKNAFSEIEDSQEKIKGIEKELLLIEEYLNKSNNNLLSCQDAINISLERIKEVDIGIARKLSEKQSFIKEKEALSSKISLFQDEVNNICKDLGQIDSESKENDSKSLSLGEQIKNLKSKIEEDKTKIRNYTEKRAALEQEEISLNKTIQETKELMHKLDSENQEIKAATYNKKLESQGLEYEKDKIKDYLKQVYSVEFVAQTVEAAINLEELLQSKDELKNKIENLGEVNLVAIEEFEELKKREDFLNNQKQDLVTSKENLKKAIAKINHTSKELFLETFRKIEVEFKKNFKFLFNGGRANLILLDEDNILESGVEIEVQPPGKKLQNVSLLSGGEKALTAIALIFSIFSVRPSPLCVLDEIDAPLDEANVDRFNHILKEFSATSQFVLITHNKKTMSNASCLYGVTMQEKGISKLVSVKFASEEVPS
ncbi:MAG: AAA family ATPase [Candidatus Omnitrophica bacterium]|jgi:chromosome segregation protein|nr:AAA family ATPase [Candidatus Omnitrophota bacterium]